MNIGDLLTLVRSSFKFDIDTETLTANRIVTFPNKSGIVALTSDITGGESTFSEVLSIISNRTLISTDVGKFILCSNTGDITILIPDDNTTILVNSEIEITRDNSGRVFIGRLNTNVTIAGDSRVNVSLEILSQHQTVTLKKVASNNWRIYGALAW